MRIYRASSLGAPCLRGLVAEQLGEKPIPHDTASELRMAEGNLHEGDVVARLLAEDGATVTHQQEEINLLFDGFDTAIVQGHLDGVTSTPDYPQSRVMEIKSTSDAEFKKFKAAGWETPGLWQKYKWQLSVYMIATGLEALFVVKNRNSGELLRFGVETPFHSLDEITERVAFLEHWVERGELPPDCPQDWFCSYKYLCNGREESAGLSPGGDERRPPPAFVVTYVELGRQIASLTAERDALKGEMEAVLGGAESVTWEGYKASRVVRNVKERVVPASRSEYIKVTKEKD